MDFERFQFSGGHLSTSVDKLALRFTNNYKP